MFQAYNTHTGELQNIEEDYGTTMEGLEDSGFLLWCDKDGCWDYPIILHDLRDAPNCPKHGNIYDE